MTTTDVIVVGVDGTFGSRAAVTYAAREAARTGSSLTLVHVSPDYSPIAGLDPLAYPITAAEARAVGHKILIAAAGEAAGVLGADRIRTELATGGRVPCLVRTARGARAIVLGDQRRMLVDRLTTGTVLGGVAARSTAPVIVVPGDWRPVERRTIVAAVKACEASGDLVRRAVALAAETGSRLVLVHAWELPSLYDDMVVADRDEVGWADARAALAADLDEACALHPGVEAELRITHGQPARVVVDATAEADLALVARRPHAFPLGYLGSTGRTIVREAHCPVMVLPTESGASGVRGVVGSAAGRP